MPGPDPLDPEDAKILTLARVAQQRAYAPYTGRAEGAAVRDTDGRTYAAATVENADPRLTTSAVRAALAAAVSSGARTFEAVALVSTAGLLATDDVALVAEFGSFTPVLLAGPDGVLAQTVHVGSAVEPA
jgi:Cytidine and deoxycytidylate deaminase zinc-binding region